MHKATRLSRLKELRRMLLNHDKLFLPRKIIFNIDAWKDKTAYVMDEPESTFCKTAACALGSAALHKPFQKLGLKISGNAYNGYYPSYKRIIEFEAGALFFGLSHGESRLLFGPPSYLNVNENLEKKGIEALYDSSYVTPKDVAKRVTILINHYKKKNTPMFAYRWEDCFSEAKYAA